MLIVMFFSLFCLSQIFSQVASYGEDCGEDSECLNYAEALNNAKYPSIEKEVHSLKPIRPDSKSLTFDSTGRVLLTRVDLSARFNKEEGEEFTTERQGWYTVFPDLQSACSEPTTETKKKRVLQLLGLPPTKSVDTVYEVFAPIDFIFRPCPDPEVYDDHCVSKIPVKNGYSAKPNAPWYCPGEDEEVVQVGEKYLDVKNQHFDWMCKTWGYNYENDGTFKNYPWTGLGYTYDWGSSTGIGLSEFILDVGANVVIHKKSTIEDYCKDSDLNTLLEL